MIDDETLGGEPGGTEDSGPPMDEVTSPAPAFAAAERAAAVKGLQNCLALASTLKPFDRDVAVSAALERVSSVVAAILRTVESANMDLVPRETLIGLGGGAQTLQKHLRRFRQEMRPGGGRQGAITTTTAEPFHAALDELLKLWAVIHSTTPPPGDAQLQALQELIEQLRARSMVATQSVAEQSAEARNRVDALVRELEEAGRTRTKTIDTIVAKAKEGLLSLEERGRLVHAEGATVSAAIKATGAKVHELAETMSLAARTTDSLILAEQSRKERRFWRACAVVTMLLVLALPGWTMVSLADGSLFLDKAIYMLPPGAAISIALLLIANYFGNQAYRSDEQWRLYRQRAMDMASLHLETGLLSPERRDDVRVAVLQRILGHQAVVPEPRELSPLGEIVRSIRRPSSPSDQQ